MDHHYARAAWEIELMTYAGVCLNGFTLPQNCPKFIHLY